MRFLRISRELIESIKAKVDFASLVAERGITLARRGQHLFGLCPFHEEKTPSFCVTPHRGLYHCFGCGVGGDLIGFVVRYDGVAFPEALTMLARRAGVELPASSPYRAPAPGASREENLMRRYAATRGEDLCGRKSWR